MCDVHITSELINRLNLFELNQLCNDVINNDNDIVISKFKYFLSLTIDKNGPIFDKFDNTDYNLLVECIDKINTFIDINTLHNQIINILTALTTEQHKVIMLNIMNDELFDISLFLLYCNSIDMLDDEIFKMLACSIDDSYYVSNSELIEPVYNIIVKSINSGLAIYNEHINNIDQLIDARMHKLLYYVFNDSVSILNQLMDYITLNDAFMEFDKLSKSTTYIYDKWYSTNTDIFNMSDINNNMSTLSLLDKCMYVKKCCEYRLINIENQLIEDKLINNTISY
jgi:hypothetical protein